MALTDIMGIVLFALAATFFLGALMHLFNLLPGKHRLLKRLGCSDGSKPEEFFHAACLMGMAAALAPSLLPVPDLVWIILYPFGVVYFGYKFVSDRISKQWNINALVHGSMLLGMWIMFVYHAPLIWFAAILAVYWLALSIFYLINCVKGNDLVPCAMHCLMCFTMVLMTIWPKTFMPHHHHHHQDAIQLDNPTTASVAVLNDQSYEQAIASHKGRLVILVYGGCENCAKEVLVFDNLASSLCGTTEFARINKDSCPGFVEQYQVKDCPKFLLFENGELVDTLDGEMDEFELTQFLLGN